LFELSEAWTAFGETWVDLPPRKLDYIAVLEESLSFLVALLFQPDGYIGLSVNVRRRWYWMEIALKWQYR